MREYTASALAAAGGVVAAELGWLRTGIFRSRSYWLAMAVVLAFQVPVDGWLTKLSDPIVVYDPERFSGVRFPLSIPVEDFAYGFALVTLAMALWERAGEERARGCPRAGTSPRRSAGPRAGASPRRSGAAGGR